MPENWPPSDDAADMLAALLALDDGEFDAALDALYLTKREDDVA